MRLKRAVKAGRVSASRVEKRARAARVVASSAERVNRLRSGNSAVVGRSVAA